MKILAFLFTILIAHNLQAQKSIFIRVYDLKGHKIARGHVVSATDTSLQLKEKTTSILLRNIGSIKTKHSAGNNILIGSVIGASTGAILGVSGSDSFFNTEGEDAAAGLIIVLPVGAAIGGITVLLKNSKTYLINGDLTSWKQFEAVISKP